MNSNRKRLDYISFYIKNYFFYSVIKENVLIALKKTSKSAKRRGHCGHLANFKIIFEKFLKNVLQHCVKKLEYTMLHDRNMLEYRSANNRRNFICRIEPNLIDKF